MIGAMTLALVGYLALVFWVPVWVAWTPAGV